MNIYCWESCAVCNDTTATAKIIVPAESVKTARVKAIVVGKKYIMNNFINKEAYIEELIEELNQEPKILSEVIIVQQ